MANNEAVQEMMSVRYGSFPEIFDKVTQLSAQYGDLPLDQLVDVFGTVNGRYGWTYAMNPQVQNQRVKGIATRPANYTKDQIAKMVQEPESNEQPLRAVERALEYTSYPLRHIRTVYQDLLTYHSFVSPMLEAKEDSKRDDFWREWKLLEKLRKKIAPKDNGHMIAGQALQEGKVFYVPRVRVDKSHNRVEHAFLQQLPSDFTKIVGFNNISKYTVAFNLMYFMMPGTDWRQFGDLFRPYMDAFTDALMPATPRNVGKTVVYAALDMGKVRENADDRVEAYYQNGVWCYWVTLPVDRVFPFEIDDTDRNVLPPFTGLFIEMIQLAQLEQIAITLLQNPLVSILHGEIPYWDERKTDKSDEYKLSNAGRLLFESLWYQMLNANSTGGIGLYMAPLQNMKLESLPEAPGATNIVAQGYEDVVAQSGLPALIPAKSDTRAGAVQVSFLLESQMPKAIYRCFERMMNAIFERLNLNYEWEFKMCGDLASDEKRREELRAELTLGIQANLLEYEALNDTSFLDDISISDAVIASDIMKRRIPLVTSFTQSAKSDGRPPLGGRPETDGVTSEGKEGDADGDVDN